MGELFEDILDPKVETPTFDMDEAVRSPYGMSTLNNYLYDSGLQSIFKDYKENQKKIYY